MFSRSLLSVSASLALLFAAGCRDSEVVTYTVPKETVTPPAAGPASDASMAATAVSTATGSDLVWTAPADWVAKNGPAMRKATYVITGEAGAVAELAVTAFPGDVGGTLANVNRWRGQLQLPPLDATALPSALTSLDFNGLHADIVELTGGGQRVLGAIVPAHGATWFFKLTGPDALVAREKAAFLAFLQTVKAP
ncbi:MAG: hypothetical protein JF599_07165 [Verrucomicrobia bacterium]|nr:hypothetical protein [Verrucomicrobiota bacterium]